jgi:RNA polymerase sigma-70 factor (ECF subfamily)
VAGKGATIPAKKGERRASLGHVSAWIEDALRTYEGPLLRYATRLCRNPEDARDAVQETFLRLCRAEDAKVSDHVGPWLYRVCRTRIFDLHRQGKPVEPLDGRLASAEPGPGDVVEARQERALVLAALEGLDPLRREALLLKVEAGLSYKEISEITGKSVSHVGVLLHEAVKHVREVLRRRR